MARIYVSATKKDLEECRTAATKILRKMRHEVVAMEDDVAGDGRPLASCVADVATCDLYVGIFAWRYGFVPQEGDGRSMTEYEYEAATRAGIPRLIFLLSEQAPWPSIHIEAIEDASAGEKIKALRKRLGTDHRISPFESPHELAALVAAAVSLHASNATHKRLGPEFDALTRYELGPSAVMTIVAVLREAARAKVLELDFGATPWWSTRLQLVALVASDETDIEALVFLDNERVLGTSSVRAVRRALRHVHPQVEGFYYDERSKLLPGLGAQDPLEALLVNVGQRLAQVGEQGIAQNVDAALLGTVLGDELVTDTAPAPTNATVGLDLGEILCRRSRFVPLVDSNGNLDRVVDAHALATQVAAGQDRSAWRQAIRQAMGRP